MTRWLTAAVIRTTAWLVERMPVSRRDFGHAVLAELAALPPGERRLGWALGGLWFVLRHVRRNPTTEGITTLKWVVRVAAAVGAANALLWAYVFLAQVRQEARDGTLRSNLLLLIATLTVAASFVACLWWWRGRVSVLATAIVLNGAVSAFAAWDNDGSPVLAAIVFSAVPVLAAIPIVLADRRVPNT